MAKDQIDREQFMVRLPAGMREKIAAAAKGNGRSMNAEIVQRLHESFRRPPSPVDVLEQHIASMEAQRDRALRAAEAASEEASSVERSLRTAYAKRQKIAEQGA